MTLIEILLLIIALLLAMEVSMNILISAYDYMRLDSLVKDMREKLEDL
jgi:hypothetical protein